MPPYNPGASATQPVSSNIVVENVPKKTEIKTEENEISAPKPIVRTNIKEEPKTSDVQPVTQLSKVEVKETQKAENVERVVLTEDKPEAVPQANKSETKTKNVETKPVEIKTRTNISPSVGGLYYTVQLGASPKPLPKGYFDKYNFDYSVDELFIDNMYKYSVGKFSTLKEANRYQNQVKQKGLQCFIVAYNNGQKVTIKEALNISKE